jgi:hypothetical protein
MLPYSSRSLRARVTTSSAAGPSTNAEATICGSSPSPDIQQMPRSERENMVARMPDL